MFLQLLHITKALKQLPPVHTNFSSKCDLANKLAVFITCEGIINLWRTKAKNNPVDLSKHKVPTFVINSEVLNRCTSS